MADKLEIFTPESAEELKIQFLEFLSYIKIDSKEEGGETDLVPYGAQTKFIDDIFEGLGLGKHWNVVLKARQLGITTISLALNIFWLGMFPGIKGALVYDTDGNRDAGRNDIERMLSFLPGKFQIPIKNNNRIGLFLKNGSVLYYLVAGTKKNGGLGRSRGLNFLHATEMSSWGDQEGLASLKRSLSDRYPHRLYIWESTARGFNLFHGLWEDARTDDLSQTAIFIGWWAKELNSFPEKSKEFVRYGTLPPTDEEKSKIALVKEKYGFEVTQEQLAWYRHARDPGNRGDSLSVETEDSEITKQELPWDEDEAFLTSGVNFFPSKQLADSMKRALKVRFDGWRYQLGEEFHATRIQTINVVRHAHLRIFEDPHPRGVYTIGADCAYGSSDKADRSVCQVLRCYADKVVQVAEFCEANIGTQQFAWVIAHLCGVYRNANLMLEINGPGEAVFNEMRTLQRDLQNGRLRGVAEEMGLRDIFRNVRQYLYHRIDSLGGGASLHWKTSGMNKLVVMNQLRDAFTINQITINSVECLREMVKVVQDGSQVEGEGSSKDDRVMALALATRAWIDRERMRLSMERRTFESENRSGPITSQDYAGEFFGGIVRDFFSQQAAQKRKAELAARRAARGR